MKILLSILPIPLFAANCLFSTEIVISTFLFLFFFFFFFNVPTKSEKKLFRLKADISYGHDFPPRATFLSAFNEKTMPGERNIRLI